MSCEDRILTPELEALSQSAWVHKGHQVAIKFSSSIAALYPRPPERLCGFYTADTIQDKNNSTLQIILMTLEAFLVVDNFSSVLTLNILSTFFWF